eukprot:scaffold141924_cov23-Tisochrysis_lutea.AAC.4
MPPPISDILNLTRSQKADRKSNSYLVGVRERAEVVDKALECGEERRVEEGKERPELCGVVLQRRPGEQVAVLDA